MILIIALGAGYFALNLPDGDLYKAIAKAEGAGSGASRFFHVVAVGTAFFGVVLGPMFLIPAKLRRWVETNELDSLRCRISVSKAGKSRDELLNEEAVILGQTTWPRGDRNFQIALCIVIAILLLPVSTALDFLPGEVTPFMRLPQYLRAECKNLSARIYGLDLKGE